MAITDINLSGKIRADDGSGVSGATVTIHETSAALTGDAEGSAVTTNSAGTWSFTEQTLTETYDVKISSSGGGQVRYIPWSDEITLKTVDTSVMKVRGVASAAAPIYLFADRADDAGDAWRIQASASDTLAIGSDKAVAGTIIDYFTITNGASAAASIVTVGGILTVTTTLDINGTADFDVTDFDIASSGDIDLVSTNDAAAAIYLRENAGTSGTIKIHADQGTSVTEGAESINILSDAGGVGIRSTANLANAVNITVDGGTTSTMTLFNDQGTSVTEGAESIALLSDAGGVGIRSTANLANAVNITVDGGTTSSMTLFNDQGTGATEGSASIQLLSDAGGINIKSGLNGANAILLTADAGTSETIVIHSDLGTGTGSIELLSDAGGIEIDAGTDIILDAGGADIFLKDDGTLFGTLTNSSGELVIKSSSSGTTAATFSGANVTLAGTVGSGAITSTGTIQGTTITATTAFVPDASDGAALGTTSLEFSDLYLADEAVIGFGDDQEVTLTHVHDAGLLLSSTDKLQFGDSGTFIHQSADGVLTIESDTTVDINGAVALNGAITGATDITLSGELDAATLDISGNADVDGTTNLDAVDIDGNVQADGTITVGVSDTGYDVKFFGATANTYMLWDENTDDLVLTLGAELYFYDAAGGEHIKSDGTDMTIYAGADLNLTAGTDINIPTNVGLTFGVDGEKIEGDGTDLSINSSGKIKLNPTYDIDMTGNDIDIGASDANPVIIDLQSAQTGQDGSSNAEQQYLSRIRSKWDGTVVTEIRGATGPDFTNNDEGRIVFTTAGAGGTLADRMRIMEDGSIDFMNTTLLNVGAAGNDWTANALSLAGGSAAQTFSVTTTGSSANVEAQLALPASSTGTAKISFYQGSGDGAANNMSYYIGYDASNGYLKCRSQDTDGSSGNADIWRISDAQLSIDANTTWDENVFDTYDDVGLIRSAISPTAEAYDFGQGALKRGRDVLIEIGVLKKYDDGFIGYNDQRMAALLAGGIYQTRSKVDELEQRLQALGG